MQSVWKNWCAILFYRVCSVLLLACGILPGAGCVRDQSTRVIETAYVRGGGVPLRDQLGPTSGLLATLQGGEKVEVLGRRTRWAQVRLPGGRTGWIHSRDLASPKLFEQFRQLAAVNATSASQGKALIRRDANLHLDAGSDTEAFYRLAEREPVEILTHRITERVERSSGGPEKEKDDEIDATPEEVPKVDVKGAEDWFLVRASGARVGWLRESFLDVDPPIEIARYNEGLRIRAWFVLFEERVGGETHSWYLWATIHPRPGLPFDYDEIRVFVWNPNKSRYETSYRERNLIGFYPIQVRNINTPAGPQPAFELQLENPTGQRFQKNYTMNGRLVRPGP